MIAILLLESSYNHLIRTDDVKYGIVKRVAMNVRRVALQHHRVIFLHILEHDSRHVRRQHATVVRFPFCQSTHALE